MMVNGNTACSITVTENQKTYRVKRVRRDTKRKKMLKSLIVKSIIASSIFAYAYIFFILADIYR